jgi:hypothetical protein
MHVRLLIDCEVPDEAIAGLAEQIADQPAAGVVLEDGDGALKTYQGRFVGAEQRWPYT